MSREHLRAPTAQVGSILGQKYVLRKLLGTGFCPVFLAQEQNSNREVVIRLLPKGGPDTALFYQAGQRTNQLQSPAMTKILERGETEAGALWYALEHLEGEDLARRLTRGPLSPGELLALLRPVCQLLEEAHQEGLIHGDLNEHHLYLSSRGVKVLDFCEPPLAKTPFVVTTPTHLAPERWEREGPPDPRSDLYSLGVICYRCLSGRLPFEAESFAALGRQHLYDPPRALEKTILGAPIPRSVAQVIQKALSKNPLYRYQTALSFLAAYEEALQEDGISLRVGPVHEPGRKDSPPLGTRFKQRAVFWLSLFSFLLVLCFFLGSLLWRLSQAVQEKPAHQVVTAAQPNKTYNQDPHPDWIEWEEQVTPTHDDLIAVRECGSLGLLALSRGGALLQKRSDGVWFFVKERLHANGAYAALWCDEESVFVASQNRVLKSQDPVGLWEEKRPEGEGGAHWFFALWGLPGGALFVAGEAGTILKSLDRGESWQRVKTPTGKSLLSLWGDQSGLYAVGRNGTILFSEDQGEEWSVVESGTKEDLLSVWGSLAGDVLISGEAGVLLQKKGGNSLFELRKSGTREDLFSVFGTEGYGLFTAGWWTILYSPNLGRSWHPKPGGPPKTAFYAGAQSASGEVYLAGEEGRVLRLVLVGTALYAVTKDHLRGLQK